MEKVCDTVKNWGHHLHEDLRLYSKYHEYFTVFLMLLSTAIDVATTCTSAVITYEWYLTVLEVVTRALFAWDCVLKVFVERGKYLTSIWNVLDLTIVLACGLELVMEALEDDWEGDAVQDLPFFSVSVKLVMGLKGLKVLRIFWIFGCFQRLRTTLSRFWSALSSVFVLLLVLAFISLMFAVLSRVCFSPYVPERFGSALNTAVTIFQLLTLDNWMEIYYTCRDNGAYLIAVTVVLFVICVTIFICSLIFAVFYESFSNSEEKENTPEDHDEDTSELVSDTEQRTDQTSRSEEMPEDAWPTDVGERKRALTKRYLELLEKIDQKHQELQVLETVQARFTEFTSNEPVHHYQD